MNVHWILFYYLIIPLNEMPTEQVVFSYQFIYNCCTVCSERPSH